MVHRNDGSTPFMAASAGVAKYEQAFRAIVWRIDQLPKRDQGAYKTHIFECKFSVPQHDPVPEKYEPIADAEYSMAQAFVSHCQVKEMFDERESILSSRSVLLLCPTRKNHRRNGCDHEVDLRIPLTSNMHLKKKKRKN